MSSVSKIRNEINHRSEIVSYRTLGSLENIAGSTPIKVLRFRVETIFPLLSKIRATMLVVSTTLLGPTATCVSGGSHPAPHWESGNANPAKLVVKAGIVVSGSASDERSGIALVDVAALP